LKLEGPLARAALFYDFSQLPAQRRLEGQMTADSNMPRYAQLLFDERQL